MSCPSWPELLRHRFDRDGVEPQDWAVWLEHLEACDACRRETLRLDPALLFGVVGRDRFEAGEAASEVERIRARVRSSLRARRVEGVVQGPHRAAGRSRRAAAAAVLLGLGLLFAGQEGPVARREPGAATMRFGDLAVPASDPAVPPMIEALDRPQARVYQLGEDDLSLVMIVDESLDV